MHKNSVFRVGSAFSKLFRNNFEITAVHRNLNLHPNFLPVRRPNELAYQNEYLFAFELN